MIAVRENNKENQAMSSEKSRVPATQEIFFQDSNFFARSS